MDRASLRDFSWDPKSRTLHGYSEMFGGGFPRAIKVISHHTGDEQEFRPVQPDHRLFDEDGWDGEQAVYTNGAEREIVLYLTHAY